MGKTKKNKKAEKATSPTKSPLKTRTVGSVTIAFPEYLTDEGLALAEKAIRDRASEVVACVTNRRDHPGYGYTKAMIKSTLAEVKGMCGMYALLTGQANHSGMGFAVEFQEAETRGAVLAAREQVRTMS